jgi:ketosteroid isomerase-like protein
MRQEARFLVGALIAVAFAGLLFVIEALWVTDVERIEQAIRAIGRAAARSDGEAVLAVLTPDVTLEQNNVRIGGPQVKAMRGMVPQVDASAVNPARALVRAALTSARFDILTIRNVRAQAGRQTQRGKAEFRVYAAGTYDAGGSGSWNFATGASGSDWSMGFRKEGDEWKVDRITALRLPPGFRIPGMGGGFP